MISVLYYSDTKSKTVLSSISGIWRQILISTDVRSIWNCYSLMFLLGSVVVSLLQVSVPSWSHSELIRWCLSRIFVLGHYVRLHNIWIVDFGRIVYPIRISITKRFVKTSRQYSNYKYITSISTRRDLLLSACTFLHLLVDSSDGSLSLKYNNNNINNKHHYEYYRK